MWRDPWGDLAADEVVSESAALLRRRHEDVEETWSTLVLDLGQGDKHADALLALAEAAPTREVRWAAAIRGLAQAGRQAEALAVFRPGSSAPRHRARGRTGARAPGRPLRGATPGPRGPRTGATSAHSTRPRPVDRFIGRELDLQTLDEALSEARLVSLVGLGGVGKSRLAQEWAHATGRAASTYWADLRACTADGVAARLAVELGLVAAEADRDHLLRLVAAGLPPMPCILAIDNADDVTDSVALATGQLLALTPHLRVLVTCRTPLGLTGERILRLPPLPLPEPGALTDGTAVELAAVRMGSPRRPPRPRRRGPQGLGCRLLWRSSPHPPPTTSAPPARDRAADGARPGALRARDHGADPVAVAVAEARWQVGSEARALFDLLVHLPGGAGAPLADALVAELDTARDPSITDRVSTADRIATERSRSVRELVRASLLVTAPGPDGLRHRALAPVSEQRLLQARAHDADPTRTMRTVSAWAQRHTQRSFFDVPNRAAIEAAIAERLNLDAALAWLDAHDPPEMLTCSRARRCLGRKWSGGRGHWWIQRGLALTGASGVERLAAIVALVNSRGIGHAAASAPLVLEAAALLDRLPDVPDSLRATIWCQRAVARGWRATSAVCRPTSPPRALAARAESAWFLTVLDQPRGSVGVLTGHPVEGIAQCERAALRFLELGDGDGAVVAYHFAAVVARMAGLPGRGRLVDAADELTPVHGTAVTRALIAGERARLVLEGADTHEVGGSAVAALTEAILLIEQGGNLHNAAMARRDLGLLHLRASRLDAARLELVTAASRLLPQDPSAAAVARGARSARGWAAQPSRRPARGLLATGGDPL